MKAMYLHIPFCKDICSYCDFCKLYYDKKWTGPYLAQLKCEMDTFYQGEELETLYIGGGTPSCLDLEELESLFSKIDQIPLSSSYEFTVEANLESLTEEKMQLLKKHRVNRLSIGMESIDPKLLSLLNRSHTKEEVSQKITLAKSYFSNINIDLMYALPGETLAILKKDLQFLLSLELPHISTYSLILEPNTRLVIEGVEGVSEELDAAMYDTIKMMLEQHNYQQYEVSNFSLPGFSSKHNLTYWNNQEYYGFGLGASGYQGKIRYTNTRSIIHYLKGEYHRTEEVQSKQIEMENELILGLRKCQGVDRLTFFDKFQVEVEDVFPIARLLEEGKLVKQGDFYSIPPEWIYRSNDILIEFIEK